MAEDELGRLTLIDGKWWGPSWRLTLKKRAWFNILEKGQKKWHRQEKKGGTKDQTKEEGRVNQEEIE